MISESRYWKKELIKLSSKLSNRVVVKRRWNASQFGAFEIEIMMAFYIIRKLLEANKLSNSLVSTKIKGRKYPSLGNNITRLNNHRFYEFYDFENGKNDKFDLIFLCNQIVHSYIFFPVFDWNQYENINDTNKDPDLLIAIQFNSGDKRNEWLFEVPLISLINLFIELGNDYPNSIYHQFDAKKKDYKVTSKKNK